MKLRILYFILGTVFVFTVGVLGFLWTAYHGYEVGRSEQPEDLVGTWRGKESWGTTYVITRRKDGTFTETR